MVKGLKHEIVILFLAKLALLLAGPIVILSLWLIFLLGLESNYKCCVVSDCHWAQNQL